MRKYLALLFSVEGTIALNIIVISFMNHSTYDDVSDIFYYDCIYSAYIEIKTITH